MRYSYLQSTPSLTERRGNDMLSSPTVVGIRDCSGSPSVVQFIIFPTPHQDNHFAVAARSQSSESAASDSVDYLRVAARIQIILNTLDYCEIP